MPSKVGSQFDQWNSAQIQNSNSKSLLRDAGCGGFAAWPRSVLNMC